MEQFYFDDCITALQKYESYGIESLNDEELLEVFLKLSFGSEDSEKISNVLIKEFGTVDNITSTDAGMLLNIDGVSEKTAVMLSLVHLVKCRIQSEKNAEYKDFSECSARRAYAKNLFLYSKNEKLVIVTLDKNMFVISHSVLSVGGVNSVYVSPIKIVDSILKDNAVGVVVMHNHPDGNCNPSAEDFNFTIRVKDVLNEIGIRLIDHIIVGVDGEFSMAEDTNIRLFD